MKYDLTIIGSGPGGYVAAIRAAQLGHKVAIIERYPTLGGTCLNVGCIPSKALLDSSEHFHAAEKKFQDHGINVSGLSVDFEQMVKRKDEVVSQTCAGVEFLMKKNKITVYTGHGSFVNRNTIQIAPKDGEGETQTIETDKVIIATGSKPVLPAAFNYDKQRVISSTEALTLKEVPKRLLVIGAGVIGLELGSVYARLGTEVEVIEYQNAVLGGMDADLGKEMRKVLKKELKIKFHLNHKVETVENLGEEVKLVAEARKDGKKLELQADYCLVAIGRRPYTDALGLENVGVELDERGRVKIDNNMQTNVEGIFAIGDVVRGAMLAHKGEEEGVYVAEYISGQKPHINYNLIPGVVYTWPEVAAVGQTEEELKAAKVAYKVGKFPFKALGRARASADTNGFVKILSDKETDEVLGVHMIGARCADLIIEAVAAMEFRASAEDMSRYSHPHPTFTEAVKEAALAATEDRALHS
ncbi:dihydrolipoamide dehydrogenase [Saprospira grandis DSM 2844]|uniref:Dihydrolipoyl dehydrogenase n=1 Tax=Saprospira grandis DSM 2844 TaxID=694433 RepID=J0PB48_9BACT|nr:dihydrolipoyl dehydrogenase [Saprospira grandis]EJF54877.1 dihydrolipoamide dehydrogenase [Saprospira grandis DSM 2844]